MHRLKQADLERIVSFLGGVDDHFGEQPLPHTLLLELAQLIPSHGLGWFEQDVATCTVGSYALSCDTWWDHDLFLSMIDLDPLARELKAARPNGVLKHSDFVNVYAIGTAHPFVAGFLRPSGIKDSMIAVLRAPDGKRRTVTLDNFDRCFSERDRTVLTLVTPHLSALWAHADHRRNGERNNRDAASRLTTRQLEILNLVAQGKTNKQIAQSFHVSPGTVRKHLDNIFERLEVNNRTAAATAIFGRPLARDSDTL
jgi:DNA-binding CsgD family transcriptional regulator